MVVYISTIDSQLFGSSNMTALVSQLLTLDVNRFSLYPSVRIIQGLTFGIQSCNRNFSCIAKIVIDGDGSTIGKNVTYVM